MELESNQNVVWWQGSSDGRLTAIYVSVLALREDKVAILLKGGRKRWVDIERIQTIRWWYHSWPAPDHIHFAPPVDRWGACTIHIEINEDLFPNRCVYEFQNGKHLRYDRSHWLDNYGSLGSLAYCHFRWTESWGNTTEITANEFADIWQRAGLPDDDVGVLHRVLPVELAEIKPWVRTSIQSCR